MKIQKHYRPKLLVSKGKEPNPLLTDPYLDAKEDRIVASNGHAMVALPVETEKGERSRYLACSLLEAARKLGDPDVPAEIQDQEVVEYGVLWPTAQERTFVDWQHLVPKHRRGDPGTITIALNARLLKLLADAMGTGGGVRLTAQADDPEAPILVEPLTTDPEEIGLLMPMRDGRPTDGCRPTSACWTEACGAAGIARPTGLDDDWGRRSQAGAPLCRPDPNASAEELPPPAPPEPRHRTYLDDRLDGSVPEPAPATPPTQLGLF